MNLNHLSKTTRTALIKTVQKNCDIADARHAGDYTLCVYLLKMREMYRWEQGISCRPHFFIADLVEQAQRDTTDIVISGREYARDMATPPAMMQNGLIFIRNESLRRML